MKIVTLDVTTRNSDGVMVRPMTKTTYKPSYIKQWREHRGLSLRRLADRLELEDEEGKALSYVSINRIEKGLQPYSQPILEAIAHALDVTVVDLLSVDPTKEGQVVDLVGMFNRMTADERADALKAIEFSLSLKRGA